jgi:hypothetical protein
MRIELRIQSNLSHIRLFMDGNYLATLETQPFTTWWTMQIGEHRLRIEGWQGDQLIEEQTIFFTVQPPLR